LLDAVAGELEQQQQGQQSALAPAVQARADIPSFAAPRYVCLVHTQVRGTLDLNGPVLRAEAAGAVVVVLETATFQGTLQGRVSDNDWVTLRDHRHRWLLMPYRGNDDPSQQVHDVGRVEVYSQTSSSWHDARVDQTLPDGSLEVVYLARGEWRRKTVDPNGPEVRFIGMAPAAPAAASTENPLAGTFNRTR